jgi:hypothetical protein
MGINTPVPPKELTAPLLRLTDPTDRNLVSAALDLLPAHAIDQVCWDMPQYIPQVNFRIAYTTDALLVKYTVSETSHQAKYTLTNDPVFKDSCVELFIAVDTSGYYYNFEFNSLGTCLASFGRDRNDRVKLDKALIATIDRWATWKEYAPEKPSFKWELTIKLPPAIFRYNAIDQFASGTYKINLYKCGDELPGPHYMAWNAVLNPIPDFHQSAYFGLLTLE